MNVKTPLNSGWIATAAFAGTSAVILGALGAHGPVADLLAERGSGSSDIWRTAVLYHLVHAAVILCWASPGAHPRPSYPSALLLIGIIGFSGSLYLLAAFGTRWLGPITPLGGLFLIAGWLSIAIASKRPRPSRDVP